HRHGNAKLEVAAVRRPDVGPQPVHDRKQRAAAVGGHFAFQCFGRTRMGIHSAGWPGLTGRKRRPSNPSHIEIFWTAITPNETMGAPLSTARPREGPPATLALRGPRVTDCGPWIPAGVHRRESGGGNERSFAAPPRFN